MNDIEIEDIEVVGKYGEKEPQKPEVRIRTTAVVSRERFRLLFRATNRMRFNNQTRLRLSGKNAGEDGEWEPVGVGGREPPVRVEVWMDFAPTVVIADIVREVVALIEGANDAADSDERLEQVVVGAANAEGLRVLPDAWTIELHVPEGPPHVRRSVAWGSDPDLPWAATLREWKTAMEAEIATWRAGTVQHAAAESADRARRASRASKHAAETQKKNRELEKFRAQVEGWKAARKTGE
jgi:hypothetical protein